MRLWPLLALVLLACSAPSEKVSDYDVPLLVSQVLAEWDDKIGFRDGIVFNFDALSPRPGLIGESVCDGASNTIKIFVDEINRTALHPVRKFRRALMHELAHVHLTCTNEDHNGQSDSTMCTPMLAPYGLCEPVGLDALTAQRIRASQTNSTPSDGA